MTNIQPLPQSLASCPRLSSDVLDVLLETVTGPELLACSLLPPALEAACLALTVMLDTHR